MRKFDFFRTFKAGLLVHLWNSVASHYAIPQRVPRIILAESFVASGERTTKIQPSKFGRPEKNRKIER